MGQVVLGLDWDTNIFGGESQKYPVGEFEWALNGHGATTGILVISTPGDITSGRHGADFILQEGGFLSDRPP